MDDFPVLGYPINPTDTCLRSECRAENWRRSWIKDPLPNELLMEAWKARVGWSLDNARTQAAYNQELANDSMKNKKLMNNKCD